MFVATCLLARFGLQEKFEFFNCKRVHSIENCMVSSSCALRQFCICVVVCLEEGGGRFFDQTVILTEIGVCS